MVNEWALGTVWPGDEMNNSPLPGQSDLDAINERLFVPPLTSGADNAAPLSSSSSSANYTDAASSSSRLNPQTEGLDWFLRRPSWNIAYHYTPPCSAPPAAVFTNFVRGLQSWLVRFLRMGHNPFIHRHLYSETTLPQCMQDAYAAIAISQTITPENEHLVDTTTSGYILSLLAANSAAEPAFLPLLSTRDHLARTQALLIHVILCLYSSSIPRRAKAESLIDTIRLWARQLWESAALDATSSPPFPNALSTTGDYHNRDEGVVSSLHRAFILSESVRRTFLLTSITTGVYTSLKATWAYACAGDVCITLRQELWEAPSSARWEAAARKEDPLFLHSLKCESIILRGVQAIEVDEYARLIFTVLWGLEKVEHWVISTGDSVSIMY
ncbi:hypothetical protein CCHL11_06090 [Colletotrichum chlorophyti]|uniref:Transcription factor gsfR2 n=1 Tax=Colletotrichum chlorophyti TaxID=708187 RepID=A0A1Q8RWK7_9PEZI|nr:hypothetical protein CCHL11_06090 [Colletotrichum chlorophyti]